MTSTTNFSTWSAFYPRPAHLLLQRLTRRASSTISLNIIRPKLASFNLLSVTRTSVHSLHNNNNYFSYLPNVVVVQNVSIFQTCRSSSLITRSVGLRSGVAQNLVASKCCVWVFPT
jgi:hypothetical protein